MKRKLIKIEYNNYIFEEITINSKILFYKKDNTNIDFSDNSKDIEMLSYLYQKFIIQKIYLNDSVTINVTIFNYHDDKIVINLSSFKNKSRHLSMQ